MEIVRIVAALVLILFCTYTFYASRTESFERSLRTVLGLKWGRQVTADLYIGLAMFCFFIYVLEGSFWKMLLWTIPTLILGNIVPLIYFVIHFDLIVNRLVGL